MEKTEAITSEDLIRFVRELKRNYQGLVSREDWLDNSVSTLQPAIEEEQNGKDQG